MQAALRARLISDAGVAALVGQRIYWIQAPQSADIPRITLNRISDDRQQTYSGFQPLRSTLVQCDIWAETYAKALLIEQAIISELAAPETSNGIVFSRPQIDASRDGFERTDTQEIYRISLDLIIWWATA